MQDEQYSNKILFEKYKIIECLKKDEYSSVYIAEHIYLAKKILLKTLSTENIPDSLWLERFKREAKILARLDHPNIIKVLDFGGNKKTFYISFEYFDSRNLRDIMIGNSLDCDQKREILIQLTRGLAAAHQAGVVHRDIKPENILIDDHNNLKIADFGLAIIMNESVLTSKSSIVGTPCYMSPEQVKGESLTHHSDLFSLGIVAYELFCGENPFLGKDINSTINNILTFEENKIFKPLTELPVDISVVIEKMLQKSVNKRPASAGDILGILKVKIDADQTKRSRKNVIQKLGLTAASLGILLILFLILRTVYNSNSGKSESGSEFIEDINLPTAEYDREQAVKTEISEQNGLNDNLAVAVTNKTVLTGKLYVESIPQVNILIDSLYSITTPFKDPFEISEGTHKLDWMHDDYPNYRRLIRIKSDQITFVNLHPDSIFGYLNCSIYPWGEVYIDDRYIGQSPFHKALIMPAGQHRVTIHNPGFLTFRDTLTILKNDTTDYKINLEQVSTIVNPNPFK